MSDFVDNLVFGLVVVFFFWLVCQKKIYEITDGLVSSFGLKFYENGAPTGTGVLAHGFVLAILVIISKNFITPCKEKFQLPEKEDEKNKKQN